MRLMRSPVESDAGDGLETAWRRAETGPRLGRDWAETGPIAAVGDGPRWRCKRAGGSGDGGPPGGDRSEPGREPRPWDGEAVSAGGNRGKTGG